MKEQPGYVTGTGALAPRLAPLLEPWLEPLLGHLLARGAQFLQQRRFFRLGIEEGVQLSLIHI